MAMYRPANVDDYIDHHEKFGDILNRLRALILSTELQETIKWNMPAYTYKKKNVLAIAAFKNHAGIWFHHGALLNDELGVLSNAQEGKTKGMRHWKFTDISDVNDEGVLLYVEEALENEKNGKRVTYTRKKISFEVPPPLKEVFKENKALASSFAALTPGRQKEYAEYIASAKREATVQSRLKKILPMILQGLDLNHMYR